MNKYCAFLVAAVAFCLLSVGAQAQDIAYVLNLSGMDYHTVTIEMTDGSSGTAAPLKDGKQFGVDIPPGESVQTIYIDGVAYTPPAAGCITLPRSRFLCFESICLTCSPPFIRWSIKQ